MVRKTKPRTNPTISHGIDPSRTEASREVERDHKKQTADLPPFCHDRIQDLEAALNVLTAGLPSAIKSNGKESG